MSKRRKDRYFDVIVRLRVKVAADAGAAGVHPPGVEADVRMVRLVDGAGDDRSMIADEADVLLVETLAVAEIDKPKETR